MDKKGQSFLVSAKHFNLSACLPPVTMFVHRKGDGKLDRLDTDSSMDITVASSSASLGRILEKMRLKY